MSESIHPSSRLVPGSAASSELTRLDRTWRPQQTVPLRPDEDVGARAVPRPEAVGFQGILEAGLGGVTLPSAPGLIAALESAREYSGSADKAVPGLGRLVDAVIEDECRKLSRYLDMQST